ncbi:hypothetical protein CASFOL_043125 [Castilleja foliolosa]|uniref:Reverse transcriptase domain-containing protein n=1 Tax=Castilleja foliolosa TaxID=1961234 RepID=A0ABD3B7H4_9LAMI
MSLSTCPHCPDLTYLFTARGLKTHITRIHKNAPRLIPADPALSPLGSVTQAASPQSDLNHLANLRKNVRVLRHIPKGARNLAASKLTGLIEKALDTNSTEDWYSILSFSFTALRCPEKSSPGSLTSKVKSNIDKSLDLFPADNLSHGSRSLKTTIEAKVFEGDLRGAVRLLTSNDDVAKPGPETLEALRSKHPAPSRPLCYPSEPDNSSPVLSVDLDAVSLALSSFNSGSSGGLDGLRPAHLKELTSGSAGDSGQRLLESLTRLCNFLLGGGLNADVCPFMYGAALCALTKKDGGTRPIAIGSVFRRLTAKLGCRAVKEEMAAYLQPHQLGFGTKQGCEAAIHATRSFVMDPANVNSLVVKLDLRNAFNSLERDSLLSAAKDKVPSLYPFLYQLYGSPSNLFYDEAQISSQVGAQQGDPLGPLVFSLAIQSVIVGLQSPLNLWYLDDGTVGGSPEEVSRDLAILIPRLQELGLEINSSKCEFYSCSPDVRKELSHFQTILPGFQEIDPTTFTLLGSPIFPEGIPEAFQVREQMLGLARDRLSHLSSHVALVLLKMCFAVPKITYLLRTTPSWLYPANIASFDDTLKDAVETILNVSLNDSQWCQASLPVRYGGLGVRRARDVGLPAFLASAHGVADLVTSILPTNGAKASIPFATDALAVWSTQFPGESISHEAAHSQRSWDDVASKSVLEGLLSSAVGEEQASLRAVSCLESGAWLHALPSPHLGTLLDADSLRVAVALRLGCKVCEPHPCICGQLVGESGGHALSCCRCSGRFPRHHALNDLIRRALVAANIPCMLEPPGLSRSDGKRPDGLTLVPWQKGRSLIWDATCVNTTAACHLSRTTRVAGAAAESAALRKHTKYKELGSYTFVPVAFETLGPWGAEAKKFVKEIGCRLRESGGDPRSGSFLAQRLSLAVQRGNAASILGSFAPGMVRGGVLDLRY